MFNYFIYLYAMILIKKLFLYEKSNFKLDDRYFKISYNGRRYYVPFARFRRRELVGDTFRRYDLIVSIICYRFIYIKRKEVI